MAALFPIGIEAEPESYGWISFESSGNPTHFFPISLEAEPEPQGWISFESSGGGGNPKNFFPVGIETEPEPQGWVDFSPVPIPQLVTPPPVPRFEFPDPQVFNAPPGLFPAPFLIVVGPDETPPEPRVRMVLDAPNQPQQQVDPLPYLVTWPPEPFEPSMSVVLLTLPEVPLQIVLPPQLIAFYAPPTEPGRGTVTVAWPPVPPIVLAPFANLITSFFDRNPDFSATTPPLPSTVPAPPPPIPPLPPFFVLAATPFRSNTVRVFLSVEPRHRSVLGARDSLNRRLWTLTALTGPGESPVVLTVENPLPQPEVDPLYPDAWSVDLRIDQRSLGDSTYRVELSALAVSQAGALVQDPRTADFPGSTVPRAKGSRP